jgi:hypothetical protein
MATNNIEVRRLYIVRTSFSSPNQRDGTKKIDDQTEEVHLRFTKETRETITRTRGKYLTQMRNLSLNFYGLMVIRESDKEAVSAIADEAHKEMTTILPELTAHIALIPLYLDDKEKGEVYGQVLAAIQGRIYSELLERLVDLAKLESVPKRSRNAVLKLVEKLRTWNVVDDPKVTETLDDIKRNIENDIFKPVVEDLQKEMTALKERGAYLEFDDEPTKQTEVV